MKRNKHKQLMATGVLVLTVAIASGFIGYAVGKGTPKRWEPGKRHMLWQGADFPPGVSGGERLEKLKELYRQDPEKFRGKMAHRGKMLRQRLERLKEEDPQKHREVIQRQIDRLETMLERLREELPETFQ